MKNPKSIFRALFLMLFLAFAGATVNAVVKGQPVTETLVTAAFILPFASIQRKAIENFDRKDAPAKKLKRKYGWYPVNPVTVRAMSSIGSGKLNQAQPLQPGMPAVRAHGTNSTQDAVVPITPELSYPNMLAITITVDDSYAGGVIPLIPQYSSDTLPSGATFSSSTGWASFADFAKYYAETSILLGDMSVTTDQRANFTKPLVQTLTLPGGSSMAVNVPWNAISQNFDQYDQNGRWVNNTNFYSGTSKIRYEFKMVIPDSGETSYMEFIFKTVGMADTGNVRPLGSSQII